MSAAPVTPSHTARKVRWVSGIVFGVATVVLAIYALLHSGFAVALVAISGVLMVGWGLYGFARYRQARRDELMQALATAMELRLPLGPVLRAYLQDRPQSGLYRFLVAMLQHIFIFPGYYWVWHGGRSFDDRVGQLVERLDEGQPLSEGLRALPALATAEARVAATIGEATGRLAPTLRRVRSDGALAAWLEVAPRLLYPWLLLLSLTSMTVFTMQHTMPKLAKIAVDFKRPLPHFTQQLILFCRFLADHSLSIFFAVLALATITIMFLANATVRWHMPLIGAVYRWEVQGLVLRLLALLVEAERPMPESLLLLAADGQLPGVARRRLRLAAGLVERGQPLSQALGGAGLLPRSMAPLVDSSQRTGGLAWALRQLGDLLTDRARNLVRRASLLVSPLVLVGIGALIGAVIVGVMLPLIDFMEALT